MNLFTKAVLVVATTSTVAVASVSWTGHENVLNVKKIGQNLQNTINTMTDESQAFFDKFTQFKSDTTTLINAKITKINDLKAQIEDLKAQLGTSGADNTALQNQINDLQSQLATANNEVAQLQQDMEVIETDTLAKANTRKTADDVDTTLSLIEETPDSPTGQQTPQEPTGSPYATQESQILNTIQTNHANVGATSVTVEGLTIGSKITIQGTSFSGYASDVQNDVMSVLGGSSNITSATDTTIVLTLSN